MEKFYKKSAHQLAVLFRNNEGIYNLDRVEMSSRNNNGDKTKS